MIEPWNQNNILFCHSIFAFTQLNLELLDFPFKYRYKLILRPIQSDDHLLYALNETAQLNELQVENSQTIKI